MAVEATHQTQYDALTQRQRDHVRMAVERGGLPTEAEEKELYAAFGHAFNLLESLEFRIEGIAESGDGSDVPTITLADIGVVAVIASDVEREIDEYTNKLNQIRRAVFSLEAIRLEQGSKAEPKEGDA